MNLKAYLATNGMTMKEFSEKLGYNYAYISRISNGHVLASYKLYKEVKKLTDGMVILTTTGKKNKEQRLLKELEALRREMEV